MFDGYTTSEKTQKIGYLSAFLAAALFGSISTVAKPALSEINPLLLSSLVYLLAAIVVTPTTRKTPLPTNKRLWLLILAVTVSGAILAPTFYFAGLAQVKASDTAILSNAEVVFTVLIAIVFFKERQSALGYFAIALVLIGAFMVTTGVEFENFLVFQNSGYVFILAATALWALDNNISRIVSQHVNVSRLVQLKSAIGGTVLVLVALLSGVSVTGINYSTIPNIIVLGTLGFGASLFFFLHSLKRIGTVRTILIFSTSAVFGLIFATILLGEQISAYQVIATAVMLLGIYLINRKEASITPA